MTTPQTPPLETCRENLEDALEWLKQADKGATLIEGRSDNKAFDLNAARLWLSCEASAVAQDARQASVRIKDALAALPPAVTPPSGKLYWPTDPSYPCPTCGHKLPDTPPPALPADVEAAWVQSGMQFTYEERESAIRSAASKVRRRQDSDDLWLDTLESHAITALQDAYYRTPTPSREVKVDGAVYAGVAGHLTVLADPKVPKGEIQVRDSNDGRVLMRLIFPQEKHDAP